MDTDHRAIAVATYNATWELIDRPDRTTAEDRDMLGHALTSRHHWRIVGEPRHHAISDWQVSRVCSLIGEPGLARSFADAAMDLCQQHDLDAFVTGCAEEALARALLVGGDPGAARSVVQSARRVWATLDEGDERDVLGADLDELEGWLAAS
jgi:hypothetical protein